MITIEQVEELRKRVNVSYEDAKTALEEANGDILEAIIILERKNIISPPEGGGFYSTKNDQHHMNSHDINEGSNKDKYYNNSRVSFGDLLKKFFNLCKKILEKGNKNNFEVLKNGNVEMTIPVTILAILLLLFFWITVPIIILGLFLGYRYAFSGPDLGKENINSVMDSMANVAENIKKEVKGDNSDGKDFDNRG